MSDDDALLAAILAQPDEDTHRLVYADWLDENGRPERAEFIRVQCELAKWKQTELCINNSKPHYGYRPGKPCSAYRDNPNRNCCCREGELERRAIALLNPHPVAGQYGDNSWEWFAQYVAWAQNHFIGRGFLCAVACTAEAWLREGDPIRAAHPVTRVVLTTLLDFRGLPDGYSLVGDPSGRAFAPEEVRAKCNEINRGAVFSTRIITALLHLRWPGVAFELQGQRRGVVGSIDALRDQTSEAPPDE